MPTLWLKNGEAPLGTIDDADLQLLRDQLEEESEEDTDYYITSTTIEFLEESGASPSLIEILKQAVGESEGADVAWR
jgi:hypothetical protein